MDDEKYLHEAINNAKEFQKFPEVLMAISLHPEWLTKIPEPRKWAILHHVIFSGDVNHLDQLLALQKSNTNFRLLTNTSENQTILDIVSSRNDIPDMKKRIEKLIKLDELLNYAKDCQWDKCYKLIEANPSFVNEKPPYRRFYLIHHMACSNAIKEYERFKKIPGCQFDLTLRADRLKINEIAKEHKRPQFAQFIEKESPGLLVADVESDVASSEARKFTEDVKTMMEKQSIVKELDNDLMGTPAASPTKTRGQVMAEMNQTRSRRQNEFREKKSVTLPTEEAANQSMVFDNLTCPITFAIFIDPGKFHNRL